MKWLLLAAAAAILRATSAESTTTIRHTSTITVVSTVYRSSGDGAAATTTASATADEHSYTDDTVFENTIIDVSNTVRKRYNASALAWNDTLADYAQRWSDGCTFQHSNGPYGENLAATYASASAAVGAWANESQHFDFHDPRFSLQTGHFSQMVWKSTTAVGCGRTDCGTASHDQDAATGWFVVCNYWPRGNVLGQFAANVDPALDQSTSSWDDEGVIGKHKNATARLAVWIALLYAQVLVTASWNLNVGG